MLERESTDKVTQKWKTKDGRIIRICDMDDNHLLNAQRMCRRTVCELNDMVRYSTHPIFAPRGDGAVMAFEQELDYMYERAASCNFIEPYLNKEVKKRGLKPLDLPPSLELPEIESVEQLDHGTIFKLKKRSKTMNKEKDPTVDDKSNYDVTHSFFIAGVQHHQMHKVLKNMEEGDHLQLVLEPTNKYDPNAVRIERPQLDGEDVMCGYVPRKFSSEVTAAFEIGLTLECVIVELNKTAKPWEQCKVEIREVK